MASYPYRDYRNEDKDQLLVETPYGLGLVVKTRGDKFSSKKSCDAIKEIRLLDWEHGTKMSASTGLGKKITKKIPMLYTTNEYPSVSVKKGDDVLTPYGRGVVEETILVTIRGKKNAQKNAENAKDRSFFKHRVILTSWRLAGRSRVKCYLFPSQVKVVRCKVLAEMNAIERVDFAIKQKQHAGQFFAQKKYNEALQLYAEAVEAVRYTQHTPNNSNECRADLLAVIVTCSNNAATCCIQLEKFEEASRFAKNALILLNALYDKRGMKIHAILLKDNKLSDSKLFGEWRGKSCLIIARSQAQKDFFDESLDNLRNAKDFVSAYTNDETGAGQKRLKEILNEILKLKNNVVGRRKVIREKEKARAKAMFASNNIKKTHPNKPTEQENSSSNNTTLNDINDHKNVVTNELKEDASHNEELNEENSNKKPLVKKVSFADTLEERHILESEEEEEEEPWYQEHKEALLLLAIGGLAVVTTAFGLRKR